MGDFSTHSQMTGELYPDGDVMMVLNAIYITWLQALFIHIYSIVPGKVQYNYATVEPLNENSVPISVITSRFQVHCVLP